MREDSHIVFALTAHPRAHFALPLPSVAEVVTLGAAAVPVPQAPPPVCGIINHGGRIVTIVDPAPLLQLAGAADGPVPAAAAVPAAVSPAAAGDAALMVQAGGRGRPSLGLRVGQVIGFLAATELEKVDMAAGPCVTWSCRRGPRLVHVLELRPLLLSLGSSFGPPQSGVTPGGWG